MNKNDIFRLDVSVNNIMFVHVAEAFKDLSGENGNWVLVKLGSFLHQIIQLAITAKFHQQVNIIIVTEISVEFDKIRMVQKHLYLDFADELVDHLVFFSHL